MAIVAFTGANRFLSNFWPATVTLDGVAYPSVESAYQAAKTLDLEARVPFQSASASEAKKLGKSLPMRADWEAVKLAVMEGLLRQKFADPYLREQLLATGDQLLQEGNHWGDVFWGVCRGKGLNHLGQLLMLIRDEIRFEQEQASKEPEQPDPREQDGFAVTQAYGCEAAVFEGLQAIERRLFDPAALTAAGRRELANQLQALLREFKPAQV